MAGNVALAAPPSTGPRRTGPRGLPLLGSALDIRRDPLGFFTRSAREYGPRVDLRVAGNRLVMFNDPNDLAHILQKNVQNYRKSKFYEGVKPLMGGILTSEGDEWLTQRRASAPAFKGAALDGMCAAMAGECDRTLDQWAPAAEKGDPIELVGHLMAETLRVAVRTLYSSTVSDDTARRVSGALAVVMRTAEARVWSPVNLPLWVPTQSHRRYAAAVSVMDEVFDDLMDERARRPDQSGDLLGLFIDAFADDRRQLRNMVVSMLLAAHETTASGLAWAFYLLARHPHWAEEVRREANAVLSEDAPTIKQVQELKVTRAVFEETLRLYPPVWTYSRDAVEADTVGDVELRPGDTAMICAYAIHRRPQLWPEPEAFRPDRFVGEAVRRRHAYAYLPFAAGPRSCLGNRFAMTEAVIVLAKTLKRYSLDLVPGQSVEAEPMTTLRPRHGIMMNPRPVR